MINHPPKDAFSYIKYLIKPGLRGFFLFFLMTFLLLIALGTWQINRLEWKNNLIQTINDNLSKPPINLDDLLIEILPKDTNPDYRHVYIKGIFERTKPFKLLMQMQNETLGYHLIVPFVLENGAQVLVNIGWVPADINPETLIIPTDTINIKGIVRSKTGRNSYTPDNDYETQDLFSLDPLEIAHEKTWPLLLPFFITLTTPLPEIGKYPLPVDIRITIRNAHLEYALTWYLLALFWVIIFVIYARRKIDQKD